MQATLPKLPVAWLLVIFLLLPAATRAETPVRAWLQPYNGPGNGDDVANAVVVDGSNNVIVVGTSTGSGSYWDYATVKYSSAGVPLWTNRYNGPANSNDEANAVAVDGSNNVIVTGCDIGSATSYDYATIKYSSEGVPLWTNRHSGPPGWRRYDIPHAVAVDRSNNVIVTGQSDGADGSGISTST